MSGNVTITLPRNEAERKRFLEQIGEVGIQIIGKGPFGKDSVIVDLPSGTRHQPRDVFHDYGIFSGVKSYVICEEMIIGRDWEIHYGESGCSFHHKPFGRVVVYTSPRAACNLGGGYGGSPKPG